MTALVDLWREVGDCLADAQMAARVMTNAALPPAIRGAAAARHAASVSALVEALTDLRRAGGFERIADFLRQRDGAGET